MEAGGTTRLLGPGRSLSMSCLASYSDTYGLQARAQVAIGSRGLVRRPGCGRQRVS